MRGMVLFLLLALAIVSFSLLAASINMNNDKSEIKNYKSVEFKTYTSAVCENKEKVVYCKDEIFVNCNGNISKAADVEACNGIKLEIPKLTGFAVFGNEWKDPRN